MKRIFILALALLTLTATAAQAGNKKKKKEAAAAAAQNDGEVHWLTFAEAEAAMKKQPRKVWIDFYTGWCGWCKKMDKTTYLNPNVVQYLNEHFYAIRMDAEQQESITFQGKTYSYIPEQKINQLAVELMQGQMTFPTSVFMQEGFANPMPPIAGYQDVPTMELILKYLAEDKYKAMPFDQWQKTFKGSWSF